jgi:glycosyltransferase involved in cell wall biosynthesis
MRICHINFAKGFRGGERQTQILIESLADLGVQQVLIARKDSPLQDSLQNVPGLVRYPISKPYVTKIWSLRHLRADLIHAHEAKAAQWALLNHWVNGTPYIMTRRLSRRSKDLAYTRAVYRNAAAVVAISDAVKQSVLQLMPELQVPMIPDNYSNLPIDHARLDQLKKKYAGRFVIGHVGALVNPHKGQSVLIAAAKQLADKYPQFIFLLIGDGPDRAMLQSLAGNAKNIEFIGFVQDVGTWIALLDLFAFPSFEEGLGSTLLDVMQQRKPIVATRVDGILEIVQDRRSGLLVPPNDPQQLAAAIEEMYLNAELRARYAAAGAQGLERYSPQRIAECYYAVYKSVLAGDAPQ